MKVFPTRSGFGLVLFILAVLLPAAEARAPGQVDVCHKGMTISVSVFAVPAHLAHGDFLGDCDGPFPE